MKMTTDFLDAHKRHWEDAELLFTAARWANADHLYGLAAECGLKRLMCAFGMEIDSASGSPARKKDRVHADCIRYRHWNPSLTGILPSGMRLREILPGRLPHLTGMGPERFTIW
jgi:hypothetical protein